MDAAPTQPAMRTVLPLLRLVSPGFVAPLFYQEGVGGEGTLVLNGFSLDAGYVSVLATAERAQLLSLSLQQQSPPSQIWTHSDVDAAMQIVRIGQSRAVDSPTPVGVWTNQPRTAGVMAKLRFVLFDDDSMSPVLSIAELGLAGRQKVRYIVGDDVAKTFVQVRGETEHGGTTIHPGLDDVELESFEADFSGHFDIGPLRRWRVSR